MIRLPASFSVLLWQHRSCQRRFQSLTVARPSVSYGFAYQLAAGYNFRHAFYDISGDEVVRTLYKVYGGSAGAVLRLLPLQT